MSRPRNDLRVREKTEGALVPPVSAGGSGATLTDHLVTQRSTGRLALRRRKSTRRPRTLLVHLTRLAILVAFFGVWQLAADQRWIDTFNYGSPSEIVSKLRGFVDDGSLVASTRSTLYEAGLGFAIAVAGAVPIGIILARSNFLDRVTQPFIDMANATPRLALAPLFVLLLGIGAATKVVLVISVVFFIMLITTVAGVRSVNPDYVRLASVCGATQLQLFGRIILPATTGYLLAGIRLSVPYALSAAVVGEMMVGSSGLGFLLTSQSGLLSASGELATVLVLALLGWVVNGVVTYIVGKLPWTRSDTRPG